jgi:hypothetical protein
MLSVENKPIMLSVIMLNVIMLSVVMLNVIMQNVVAPDSWSNNNVKAFISAPPKYKIDAKLIKRLNWNWVGIHQTS